MRVGEGDFKYVWDKDWGADVKDRWKDIKEVAGITVDACDNVYLLTRVQPPVIVLNKAGEIIDSFGDGVFARPHGIYLSTDGSIFGVDDAAHTVFRFDKDKNLIGTLGTHGQPSDTGWTPENKTVLRSAGPFNRPTRIALDVDGYMYVTDGYRNARVHKFDPHGNLVASWGEPGTAPGEFQTPHGIGVDSKNILYVADRQNHRIQRFDTEGTLIDIWEGFHRPSDVWIDKNDTVYVAECKRTSEFDAYPSRVSILDAEGQLLARLGRETMYDPELGSRCAHGVAVDSEGSLYIAEVGKKLKDEFFGVRKFVRDS